MQLGALSGHSQAQLDGFKSRALRAEALTQRHLYATEWRCDIMHEHARRLTKTRQEQTKLEGAFVQLSLDGAQMVLQLNDPERFNTIGTALCEAVRHTAQHVRTQPSVGSVVLQGVGPHFSPGGNPFSRDIVPSLAGFALSLRELYYGFLQLRTLPRPVVGAVHGSLVGGGVAGSLHVDFVAADHASTFEHGNLVRGVCVLGMLSQTFAVALGPHAQHIYLQNARLGAVAACAAGLVQQLCAGVYATQLHARQIAARVSDSKHLAKAICCARAAIDLATLAREATGHAECMSTNGGFAKSKLQTHTSAVEDSLNLRVVPESGSAPRGLAPMLLCVDGAECISENIGSLLCVDHAAHENLRLAARPMITLAQRDCLGADRTPTWSRVELAGSAVELRVQEQRLWCCCLEAASVCEANVLWNHAPSPAVLSFDEATGVAAVELDGSDLVPALEAAPRLLLRLGPVVRAVALHIAGNSWPLARLSSRTLERAGHALDALHGVPVVCSADDNVCGAGSAMWSAADYRVAGQHLHGVRCKSTSEESTRPRERGWQFAAWLAHHPYVLHPPPLHIPCRQ